MGSGGPGCPRIICHGGDTQMRLCLSIARSPQRVWLVLRAPVPPPSANRCDSCWWSFVSTGPHKGYCECYQLSTRVISRDLWWLKLVEPLDFNLPMSFHSTWKMKITMSPRLREAKLNSLLFTSYLKTIAVTATKKLLMKLIIMYPEHSLNRVQYPRHGATCWTIKIKQNIEKLPSKRS